MVEASEDTTGAEAGVSSSTMLEELLAEAQGTRPSPAGLPDMPRLQADEEYALPDGNLDVSKLRPPLSPHDGKDRYDGSVSPLSQQIADLCSELDSCLGNLDEWRKQGSRRCEDLKRELEKEYGFSYEEPASVNPEEAWLLQDADDADLSTAAVNTAEASEAPAPGGDGSDRCRELFAGQQPGPASDGDSERQRVALTVALASASEDEARLERLRREVAELKRRAEQQGDFEAPEIDAASLLALGASDSSMHLGLSGWCDEVDSLLGPLSHKTDAGGSLDEVDALQLEDVERRLEEAQLSVVEAEGALDSACGRLNGQVGELEALLEECQRLGEGLGEGPETEGQPVD